MDAEVHGETTSATPSFQNISISSNQQTNKILTNVSNKSQLKESEFSSLQGKNALFFFFFFFFTNMLAVIYNASISCMGMSICATRIRNYLMRAVW